MKSRLFWLLTMAIMTGSSFTANAQFYKKKKGNDKYITRDFKLADFSKIELLSSFTVTHKVNPDSAGWVKIYGEENILDLMAVRSEKGTFSVKFNSTLDPEFGIVLIHVYSSGLKEASSKGGATLELVSKITTPEVKLSVVGEGQIIANNVECEYLTAHCGSNGDILVAGKAEQGHFSISGSGEVRAQDMKADIVKAVITGSGTIKCDSDKELKTVLTGSGTVFYKGSPEIKSTTVGNGKVVPLK